MLPFHHDNTGLIIHQLQFNSNIEAQLWFDVLIEYQYQYVLLVNDIKKLIVQFKLLKGNESIWFVYVLYAVWTYFHHCVKVQYVKLQLLIVKFLLLPDESLRFHSNLYRATVFAEGFHQKSVVTDAVCELITVLLLSTANAVM